MPSSPMPWQIRIGRETSLPASLRRMTEIETKRQNERKRDCARLRRSGWGVRMSDGAEGVCHGHAQPGRSHHQRHRTDRAKPHCIVLGLLINLVGSFLRNLLSCNISRNISHCNSSQCALKTLSSSRGKE